MQDIKSITEYALAELKKAGADKADCQVIKGRKDEFNAEAGKFSLLRTVYTDNLVLKAIIGNKKGVATVNKLDKLSIDEAIASCIELTQSAIPDEAEDIAPLIENKTFGEEKSSDMEKLFSRTKEFLGQVESEFPKIAFESLITEFNSGEHVYANSNGVYFSSKQSAYHTNTIFSAKDGDNSTSFNYSSLVLDNLDTPFMDIGLTRQLFDESVKSLNPKALEGKFIGKVIVTPACADLIWGTLLNCFLNDFVMIQGTSRWKDALNTMVADSKLTMRLSPLNPNIVTGERFTRDGFASQDVDIIKDGILKSFFLSLYGANKTGKPRTGTLAYENIEVLAGDTPLEDIIKGVDKGILLNRFSGAEPTVSGDISGVAKNSFLIENGKITDAIQETMISFNILDALKNIVAISKEQCSHGYSILPWCCFDGITISGK